jgi:hypothetical protein
MKRVEKKKKNCMTVRFVLACKVLIILLLISLLIDFVVWFLKYIVSGKLDFTFGTLELGLD